jgi:integration host factor subunit alpha
MTSADSKDDDHSSGEEKPCAWEDREGEVAGGTLTRADLARAIQSAVGLPRREAAELVEMVLGEIIGRLTSREEVKLSSFGTFSVREKPERIGRNPRTGAGAKISARLVVTFKPSSILRARIEEADVSDESAAAADDTPAEA